VNQHLEDGKSSFDASCAGRSIPRTLVTHRLHLNQADEAYRLMAAGDCGKVAVVFDEEIR
jgi:threonine dehydrogenase-like Zn-dependent dehydrogenase